MSWITTIDQEIRKSIGLDMNEYAIADYIYYKCTNPNGKVKGWCYASRQKIADEFGFKKQTIIRIIDRLIEKEFVQKHPITKHLKTTKKWFRKVASIKHNLDDEIGNEKLPVVTKSDHVPVVTKSDQSGNKKLPASGHFLLPNTLEFNTKKESKSLTHTHEEKKSKNFSNPSIPLNASSDSKEMAGAAASEIGPVEKLLNVLKKTGKAQKGIWQQTLGKRSMAKAAQIFANYKIKNWENDVTIKQKLRTLSAISLRSDFGNALYWIIERIDREESQNGKTKKNHVYYR
jgi:hypothetical protein